jgi:uncharacterized membrane protein YcjF (UPF0283 family)
MHLPKLIYWFATILLCLLLLFSASMYLFNHSVVLEAFTNLNYPSYLIYPLAIAKVLAVVAIVSNKSLFLKQLAYAGLFYNFLLAFLAHAAIGDGGGLLAFLGLIMLGISYFFHKILKPKHKLAFEV